MIYPCFNSVDIKGNQKLFPQDLMYLLAALIKTALVIKMMAHYIAQCSALCKMHAGKTMHHKPCYKDNLAFLQCY